MGVYVIIIIIHSLKEERKRKEERILKNKRKERINKVSTPKVPHNTIQAKALYIAIVVI